MIIGNVVYFGQMATVPTFRTFSLGVRATKECVARLETSEALVARGDAHGS